jgi:colanic acid/amylovoran biosynthesis glycosyltransferase
MLMHGQTIAERLKRRLFMHTGIASGFYRKLSERQPALLHAHFAPDGALALPVASALGIPLLVTLHGYDATSSEKHLNETAWGHRYLKRKQKLLETAAFFVCASNFIRQRALEHGFPESKLRVLYIGVDPNVFAPITQDREQGTVLFVGRLVEQKGGHHLIGAMDLVQRQFPQAKLVIIGDGPARASLEMLAQNAHISCQFMGRQPSTVVREWLARSRVFCGPSITGDNGACEGLGIVFAEAQAMGVPVVSFRHGGIPEVVRHGETGLLAPEGDHELLAAYLLRYLTDDAFWCACSQQAIKWILSSFDLHKQTRKLEELYREAIHDTSADIM